MLPGTSHALPGYILQHLRRTALRADGCMVCRRTECISWSVRQDMAPKDTGILEESVHAVVDRGSIPVPIILGVFAASLNPHFVFCQPAVDYGSK